MRRPRLIIIEGPDGSGKTSLVNALVTALGEDNTCVLKSNVPEGPPLNEYVSRAYEGWLANREWVIMDRFHLGEQVYGPVMRGSDKLGPVGREVLEHWLLKIFRPVVVLCLPPYELCHEVWSSRLVDEYVKEDASYRKTYEIFGRIKTDLRTVTYDWTKTPWIGFLERLS